MFNRYIVSLLFLTLLVILLNIPELPGIFAFITGDFPNLFNSTLMTFSIAFLSALILMVTGIFFSWCIFRLPPLFERGFKIIACISVIPSVLAIMALEILDIFPGSRSVNFTVVVTALAFLNLTFLFVFSRLNRQLQEEFNKPYHAMTRQLAQMSVFRSSFGKIIFIVRDSFKSMMILTFSATVFIEARLSGSELYKGIYSYFFMGYDRDRHAERKMAILLFILLFLVVVMSLYSFAWSFFYKHYRNNK